jgi:hypothetical protein
MIDVALALLAAEAPGPPPAYLSGFCAYVAMSEAEPAQIRQLYAEAGARTEPDAAAAAFKPEDVSVFGQMVSFRAPGSPKAFVERRRGSCALVYPSAHAPEGLAADLAGGVRMSSQRVVAWKRVDAKKVGPPGPMRYFLPASDDARFGVCAAVFEDLRLHDATPATLVRVETCRLAADDSLE